jgi:hypothetical protein
MISPWMPDGNLLDYIHKYDLDGPSINKYVRISASGSLLATSYALLIS